MPINVYNLSKQIVKVQSTGPQGPRGQQGESGSAAVLPSGLISGSSQVDYNSISNRPNNLFSSSQQLPLGLISSSVQIKENFPTGVISSSQQVDYTLISSVPTGIVSSSAQISYTGIVNKPNNLFSSSAQIGPTGIYSGSGTVPNNTTTTLAGNYLIRHNVSGRDNWIDLRTGYTDIQVKDAFGNKSVFSVYPTGTVNQIQEFANFGKTGRVLTNFKIDVTDDANMSVKFYSDGSTGAPTASADFQYNWNDKSSRILFYTNDWIKIKDESSTPKGLQYFANYTASILSNDRSLADVGTVKALIQASASSGGTDGNGIYGGSGLIPDAAVATVDGEFTLGSDNGIKRHNLYVNQNEIKLRSENDEINAYSNLNLTPYGVNLNVTSSFNVSNGGDVINLQILTDNQTNQEFKINYDSGWPIPPAANFRYNGTTQKHSIEFNANNYLGVWYDGSNIGNQLYAFAVDTIGDLAGVPGVYLRSLDSNKDIQINDEGISVFVNNGTSEQKIDVNNDGIFTRSNRFLMADYNGNYQYFDADDGTGKNGERLVNYVIGNTNGDSYQPIISINHFVDDEKAELFLRVFGTDGQFKVYDGTNNQLGIQYDGDYSSTIIDNARSIPDVGTVQQLIQVTPSGIYGGSGTIPNNTNAQVATNGIFQIKRSDGTAMFYYDDSEGVVNLLSRAGGNYIQAADSMVSIGNSSAGSIDIDSTGIYIGTYNGQGIKYDVDRSAAISGSERSIPDVGTIRKMYGVSGVYTGTTTSGNQLNMPHGLSYTPTVAIATVKSSATLYHINFEAAGASTVSFRIYSSTGAAVSNGTSITISYMIK